MAIDRQMSDFINIDRLIERYATGHDRPQIMIGGQWFKIANIEVEQNIKFKYPIVKLEIEHCMTSKLLMFEIRFNKGFGNSLDTYLHVEGTNRSIRGNLRPYSLSQFTEEGDEKEYSELDKYLKIKYEYFTKYTKWVNNKYSQEHIEQSSIKSCQNFNIDCNYSSSSK